VKPIWQLWSKENLNFSLPVGLPLKIKQRTDMTLMTVADDARYLEMAAKKRAMPSFLIKHVSPHADKCIPR
jgi:hypothetical protein